MAKYATERYRDGASVQRCVVVAFAFHRGHPFF
jgi:hypothetical protein